MSLAGIQWRAALAFLSPPSHFSIQTSAMRLAGFPLNPCGNDGVWAFLKTWYPAVSYAACLEQQAKRRLVLPKTPAICCAHGGLRDYAIWRLCGYNCGGFLGGEMVLYRRMFRPAGTYFFTLNLLERRGNDLLIRHCDSCVGGFA